jgi:hypothetical protein
MVGRPGSTEHDSGPAALGNGVLVFMKRITSPRVAVFIVFVASLFMSIMDGTIVNVALSTISRDLAVDIAATDVIVVAYLVSLAVTMFRCSARPALSACCLWCCSPRRSSGGCTRGLGRAA